MVVISQMVRAFLDSGLAADLIISHCERGANSFPYHCFCGRITHDLRAQNLACESKNEKG